MLELRYLSTPHVVLNGSVVEDFVSYKARALLFYLERNEGLLSRTTLAGLLWGKLKGKRARANLRVALHNLRELFPGYLKTTRNRAAFNTGPPYWSDVAAIQEMTDQKDAPEPLAKAIDLYQYDFLKYLNLKGAPQFEAWRRAEQEKHRVYFIELLEKLSELYIDRQMWDKATATLRRLLIVEPYREEAHRHLMMLLVCQGRFTAALAQYKHLKDLLKAELKIEPMPATVKFQQRIKDLRSQSPANPETECIFCGHSD